MQKAIIADTSCLVLLDKLGELIILQQLFGEIIITGIIKKEYGQPLPSWIKVVDPEDAQNQNLLQAILDAGESSAIALALELGDCLLVLDDRKARNVAAELNLLFTGTIGVLLDAKRKGHIKSMKEVIERIRKTDFRLSKDAEQTILRLAGE